MPVAYRDTGILVMLLIDPTEGGCSIEDLDGWSRTS